MQKPVQEAASKARFGLAVQLDVREPRGGAPHARADLDEGSIRQVRHIIELCLVLNGRVEPDAAVCSDKALRADRHAPEDQPTVLDPVPEHLGVASDATSITNRNEVECGAERGTDDSIFADFCAHESVIETHQWRIDEHL